MMISLLFLSSLFLLSVSGSSVQGRVVSVVSPEELLDQDHQVSVRWDGKTSKDLHRYVFIFLIFKFSHFVEELCCGISLFNIFLTGSMGIYSSMEIVMQLHIFGVRFF